MSADNKDTKAQPGLPFKTRCKLFLLELASRITVRSDGTINRCLYNLLDIKAPAPATKLINTTRVSTLDVPIDPSINLWFCLFTPTTTGKLLPLIVYYHGGGFLAYGPDSKSFDTQCSHIAAKVPAVVASINYRLAPHHQYPIQYEDGFDALKFIDAQNYAVLPDYWRCSLFSEEKRGQDLR